MNTRHNDILNAISRMMWLSTTGVAEAIEPLGYGGGKPWSDYRDMISKDLGYLKSKGLIKGEDRPQTKGKPVRYWSLANPQPYCHSADHSEHDLEMVSDVAEVEATTEESSVVQETVTPEPISVEVANKSRLSAEQLIQGYKDSGSQGNMLVFAAGVAFAEKYHGIG